MSGLHAIILGAIQGLTELFPVSSLGHSVLLPHRLGWQVDEAANSFLIFLVATHLATSLVLFWFYRRDWMRILGGMGRSLRDREIAAANAYGKIGWLLVVGTIPAGLLGLLFEDKLNALFASPIPVSLALAINGLLLLAIERRIARNKKTAGMPAAVSIERVANISWRQSATIGVWQCLALFPGFSRTGATLGGGLLSGLDHADAAYFSFLLATPVIFAAAALKLPELAGQSGSGAIGTILLGATAAAIAAAVSVRYLSRYFKTKTLTPFGIYCLVIGLCCLAYFVL